MTLPFKNIPQNVRVPLFYAEVDNSQANTAQQVQRTLIIGQFLTANTAVTANMPSLNQGIADAQTKYGLGSVLAQMVEWYRKRDSFGEVWCLPLSDAAGAVAATGSLNFTAQATATGALNLYIGGTLITMPVASTQTPAQLATALAAAVNAVGNCPVTAAVDGTTTSKVNFTAKNAGLLGNDIDIRLNYLGAAGGETTPTGLTVAIIAMANGVTNPTLTTALANLASWPFDFIVMPYTDTTSLDAIKAFLNDQTGRWSWEVQVYGHCFTATRGTVGSRTTLGTARNNQHESIMGFYDSPTPVWCWAANVAGAAAASLRVDPGLPLQTLALDVQAPPIASRDQLTDRNTLLYDGISTYTVAQDGTCMIENLITTYQKNAFGQADNSYLEIETLFLLMYILRRFSTMVLSRFARVKLAADGTRFAPGSNIVTPSTIKAAIIALYQTMEYEGYVQNSKAFAQSLIVEINASNPNRIDVLWPVNLIEQLRIFALLAQFRLS